MSDRKSLTGEPVALQTLDKDGGASAGSKSSPTPTELGDVEKGGDENGVHVTSGGEVDHTAREGQVHRNLKQRHLSMIALGGTIGTGLFVGSGSALATGGPVGCLLGYMIMGVAVYSMMVALGEMGTLFPDAGGFVHHISRFTDPSLGFAVGWNYWYSYAVTIPTELVACALVVQYWNTSIDVSAWIAPLFVLIVVVNFCGVQVYGELEFWFSAIKIIAIVVLILVGIAIDCGAGPQASGYIGFRYWKSPWGPFNNFVAGDGTVVEGRWGQFVAFWAVLVQAAFSFIGTEILGVTVGEAANPRVAFPRAIKRTFWRITIFYVLAIFIIGILVPSDSDRLLNSSGNDASSSPFVIAIDTVGIAALPHIINAVLLVAAWSAGNSDLYAASRTLYALAVDGQAPKIFKYCTKNGLPVYCIGVTALWGVVAFAASSSGTAALFDWLYNLGAISAIITWWLILGAYLRFYYGRKKQGLPREALPYIAPFQPYLSWFGFVFFFLVIWMNGFPIFIGNSFTGSGLVAAYICIPIFVVITLGYKYFGGGASAPRSGPGGIFRKTTWVTLENMDFTTGLRELDAMDEREQNKVASVRPTLLTRVFHFMF